MTVETFEVLKKVLEAGVFFVEQVDLVDERGFEFGVVLFGELFLPPEVGFGKLPLDSSSSTLDDL